ncbi:MAG: CarD family transcriptional regulator [Bacteriovoracaceae bacterium]|jgi:CarD family transcriptional regulator|nr:CarD family transcriptional regulator [Halobacteriovoraceae bacterium]MDP7321657.1 CarD family transcriptional regulator [Bacteriovoracaceae bacterium]
MFEIGNYVVCPGHGVGQILNLETKNLGDEEKIFYIVKIISNGMTIMVPSDKKDGLRELVSDNEVNDVFKLLQDHEVKVDNSTWNRRHRDYLSKVKTGSLLEIADVLRSLFLLKNMKKLSFGERKMMDQCKELIIKEIAISTGENENQIDNQIDSCFND